MAFPCQHSIPSAANLMFLLLVALFASMLVPPIFCLRVTLEMPHPQSNGAPGMGGHPSTNLVKPEERIMQQYHQGMMGTSNSKRLPPTSGVKRTPAMERIQMMKNKLDNKEITYGELIRKQDANARQYAQGKALASQVSELGRMPLENVEKLKSEERKEKEKEKRKKEERKIAVVATRIAMNVAKETIEENIKKATAPAAGTHHHHSHRQHHHHHQSNHHNHNGNGNGKGRGGGGGGNKSHGGQINKLKKEVEKKWKGKKEDQKANKAQQGFMAIVMHEVKEPPKGKQMKNPPESLKTPKDVHNLLWTAVSLARKKLSSKTAAPPCLLEFLGRMVGGAFAPFVYRENEKHIGDFLQRLRRYEVAFLSSGYRRFWRDKFKHVKRKFEHIEKEADPVFINHEF